MSVENNEDDSVCFEIPMVYTIFGVRMCMG